MRVLAIETSSVRGTLALIEAGQAIAVREHDTPNAHGERLLGMLEAAQAEAGWTRTSIDRVAVGIGPGSFTGLRVGIAFAQGVATGLGRPLVGVSSLQAMADAASFEDCDVVAAILDARRGDVFLAAYDAEGRERLAPAVARPADALDALETLDGRLAVVGAGAGLLGGLAPRQSGVERDLPHAVRTGRLAERLEPGADVAPAYLRPADAIRPNLPPSPLSSAREP